VGNYAGLYSRNGNSSGLYINGLADGAMVIIEEWADVNRNALLGSAVLHYQNYMEFVYYQGRWTTNNSELRGDPNVWLIPGGGNWIDDGSYYAIYPGIDFKAYYAEDNYFYITGDNTAYVDGMDLFMVGAPEGLDWRFERVSFAATANTAVYRLHMNCQAEQIMTPGEYEARITVNDNGYGAYDWADDIVFTFYVQDGWEPPWQPEPIPEDVELWYDISDELLAIKSGDYITLGWEGYEYCYIPKDIEITLIDCGVDIPGSLWIGGELTLNNSEVRNPDGIIWVDGSLTLDDESSLYINDLYISNTATVTANRAKALLPDYSFYNFLYPPFGCDGWNLAHINIAAGATLKGSAWDSFISPSPQTLERNMTYVPTAYQVEGSFFTTWVSIEADSNMDSTGYYMSTQWLAPSAGEKGSSYQSIDVPADINEITTYLAFIEVGWNGEISIYNRPLSNWHFLDAWKDFKLQLCSAPELVKSYAIAPAVNDSYWGTVELPIVAVTFKFSKDRDKNTEYSETISFTINDPSGSYYFGTTEICFKFLPIPQD
jgi:hypothetical protein